MISLVKDNITALLQVYQDLSVSKLYLFGNAARETGYNHSSDIDFLFRFDDNVEKMEIEKNLIISNYFPNWKMCFIEK